MKKNNINPIYLQEGIDILAFLEFLKKFDPRKYREVVSKILEKDAQVLQKAYKAGLNVSASGDRAIARMF